MKDKMILKDNTTIELEAGSSLANIQVAAADRADMVEIWGKLTEDNLSSVQIQTGTTYQNSYGKTLAGSGPIGWNHDRTAEGVADMVGNVWEHVGGVRFLNGQVQIIPNNEAAAGADQSPDSKEWTAIYTPDGDPVYYNVKDGEIVLQPTAPKEKDYDGVPFCDLHERTDMEVPDKLIELGLYPAPDYESEEYFWLDTDGERCAYRGGCWHNGVRAGVFSLSGDYSRSYSNPNIGFRSALVRYSGDSGDLDHAVMRNEIVYDDRGLPDILVVFTPDELKLPDTLKGRKVKEYAISKYPNTMIDGRPYSLPFMPPAVNVNHDEAIRLCEAKGPGWHLITNDEWAALGHQSWENDTVPTGNTSSGKSHSHPEQTGAGLTVGTYTDLVLVSETSTVSPDGTVLTSYHLREKTDEEKRLDALEEGQTVQDGAISDLGSATSALADQIGDEQ